MNKTNLPQGIPKNYCNLQIISVHPVFHKYKSPISSNDYQTNIHCTKSTQGFNGTGRLEAAVLGDHRKSSKELKNEAGELFTDPDDEVGEVVT